MEVSRRELDKRRRAVAKFNRSESVVNGTTPPKKKPDVLPSSWQCPPPRPNRAFEDPFVPLIGRFVPRLCEGLGFPPSPFCFSGKTPLKRRREGECEARATTSQEIPQQKKCRTESEVSTSPYTNPRTYPSPNLNLNRNLTLNPTLTQAHHIIRPRK